MPELPSESLVTRTRVLLESSELPLSEIAKGAHVGFEWLRKFAGKADHDFGVNKVQALHDFLAAPTKPRQKKASAEVRPI